ncbi:MAG: DUF3305 domain-containing protein [Alphaproteobacteria bacterium]|nr:DUF3305 domain-containing protein [Alphaproteobacteria bacterium]
MATATLHVGIVVECRKAVSPWADVLWRPLAVLPAAPDLPDWAALGGEDGAARFYAGGHVVELHRTDTPTYRDNLASGTPRMWVAARLTGAEPPLAIAAVTADPAEGEAWTEAGDDIVESLPMPAEIAAAVAAFVAEHHVERPFIKRRRKEWSEDDDDA